MKYRKKPVVIEAFQWKSQHDKEWPLWLKENLNANVFYFNEDRQPCIKTLEGIHTVSDNDYIIKGVKGEIYPCKPDIFELTYENAEAEKDSI